MNYLKNLSLVCLLILTGCSSNPISTVNLKEKEVVKISIPEELLTPCKPEKPLDKDSYLKLNILERESYLTDYSISLLKELKICDSKIQSIRNLNNKFKE